MHHPGEYETPEAAWPAEISEHREAGRDEQAEKPQDRLDRLRELTQ
jgi:hypothetical protein